MNKGTYYLGDPYFALNAVNLNKIYEELGNNISGIISLDDHTLPIYSTLGKVTVADQYKNIYMVESSLIALIPITFLQKDPFGRGAIFLYPNNFELDFTKNYCQFGHVKIIINNN